MLSRERMYKSRAGSYFFRQQADSTTYQISRYVGNKKVSDQIAYLIFFRKSTIVEKEC
jgi:hypothetical protein